MVAVEQAVAAPLCSRHLNDLGASVIKVERPDGGDFARGYDSHVEGFSTYFVWLNHGKKSVAVDLATDDGREILHRLASDADVFLTNLAPRAVAKLFDDRELAAANSRLVRCYVSGYGSTGPYRDKKAYDALVQGEAGITLSTGTSDMPAKAGVSLVDLAAGLYALSAITAALTSRSQSGVGTRLDISLFDAAVEWMMPLLLTQTATGSVPPPVGVHHSSIVPYGAFETSDGQWINIAVQNDAQWRAICIGLLGDAGLVQDERFASNEMRVLNRNELEERLSQEIATRRFAEVSRSLDRADLPWGRLNTIADLVGHPQLAARHRWINAELPGGQSATVVASPFAPSAGAMSAGRVPTLGEHTLEVLLDLGYAESQISQLVQRQVVRVPPDLM